MYLKAMLLVTVGLLSLVLIAAAASKQTVSFTHVVDLTHTLSAKFPIVPVPGLTFAFDQKPIASLEKNKVYAEQWHMIAHNGTHIDGPNHYIKGDAPWTITTSAN